MSIKNYLKKIFLPEVDEFILPDNLTNTIAAKEEKSVDEYGVEYLTKFEKTLKNGQIK